MSGPMMVQLDEAVRSLEEWRGGSVLLVSGEGGHFCSGADLGTVRAAIDTPERGALMSALLSDTLNRLRNLPLFSIAAVDGAAVGGGAELCTATDLRVVAQGATIQFVHTRLGAAPGWGGAARLVQEVGRARALRLLLLSEKLDAAAAVRLGLAHACGAEGEAASDSAMRTVVAPALEVLCYCSMHGWRSCRPVLTIPGVSPGRRPGRWRRCARLRARWPRAAQCRVRSSRSTRGSLRSCGARAPTATPCRGRPRAAPIEQCARSVLRARCKGGAVLCVSCLWGAQTYMFVHVHVTVVCVLHLVYRSFIARTPTKHSAQRVELPYIEASASASDSDSLASESLSECIFYNIMCVMCVRLCSCVGVCPYSRSPTHTAHHTPHDSLTAGSRAHALHTRAASFTLTA